MNPDEIDAETIKFLREEKLDLTREQFANACGVSKRTVYRWESDETTPDDEKKNELAELANEISTKDEEEVETFKQKLLVISGFAAVAALPFSPASILIGTASSSLGFDMTKKIKEQIQDLFEEG